MTSVPSIDGYRNLQLIGSGGSSKVYTAHQEQLARTVAVKVVTVDLTPFTLLRLRREQAAARQLDGHPHIIRTYESGTTADGRPYTAMEHHERGSYADRVRRHGTLPLAEALDGGVKLAGALACAHQRGIVHQSVKPQNVLVARPTGPVLSDFGMAAVDTARLDATGESFTALHLAPEVLDGHPPTPASDVYSLVSTLYELLTGAAPYAEAEHTTLNDLLRHMRGSPPPLLARDGVPAAIAEQIAMMMDRVPENRPTTGYELAEQLRTLQARLGLDPTPIPLHSETALPTQPGTRQYPPMPLHSGTDPEPGSGSHAPFPGPSTGINPPSPPARPETPGHHKDAGEARSPLSIAGAACAIILLVAGWWWVWSASTSSGTASDAATEAGNATLHQDEGANLPPCPAPTGEPLPDPAPVAGEPPTELQVEVANDGQAATVRWNDPNDTLSTYLVYLRCQGDGGNGAALRAVGPGEAPETTFEALSTRFNYCYTVAVLGPDATATPYTAPDGTHFRCTDQSNH